MENQTPERRQRVLSAIQPTAIPTLGNYLGALRNWKAMSDDYDCVYAVADLHAITVRQDPATLRRQTMEAFALLLSIGLDPDKTSCLSRAMSTPMPSSRGFSTATPSSARLRE